MELLAGDRLGKYEVIGRLAAGGMAEVYLAKILGHGGFAKAVALKRMLPALAEESGFREMFMQEASLAARLNHPHVVQIFDFAEEGGELYLAMEYVHGVNLRQLHADALKRAAKDPSLRIPPMLAAHIARCVARALACAWTLPDEKGAPLHLIHRDVSPHNVLLSWQGDVKLADFGIAKPAGALTSVGTLKGKLLYMAPEQLLGGPLDARSDLFALGIVLYETALGMKPLFDGPDQETVKRAIKQRAVVPPIRFDPDFPPRLSDVIMKALERDPGKRFQSGAEFADALGECLHHEAKSAQEYDLAAYMTRMYGEPQPLRGFGTPEPHSSSAVSAPAAPTPVDRPDLERVANDGRAETVMRELAPREREAADPGLPSRPTIRVESPEADASGPESAWQKRKQRTTVKDRGQSQKNEVQAAIQKVLEEQAEAKAHEEALAASEVKGPALLGGSGVEPTQRAVNPAAKWFAAAGLCVLAVMAIAWGTLGRQQRAVAELAAVEVQPTAPTETAKPLVPEPEQPQMPGVEPESPKDPPPPEAAAAPASAPAASSNKGPEERVESKPAQPDKAPAAENTKVAAPVRAPATPAPAKKGTGTLVIHIRPWVHAWVDGEKFNGGVDQEAAPRLTRPLSAGRHLVHLRDGKGRQKSIETVIGADRQVIIEGTFDDFAVR
ncbi:MAG: serine/threonine-protein kinase [Myxococcales bacterium]